ncbi:MAG: DUF2341 domain-containing protein [Candidatus Heimdallarchaeota archaeon]
MKGKIVMKFRQQAISGFLFLIFATNMVIITADGFFNAKSTNQEKAELRRTDAPSSIEHMITSGTLPSPNLRSMTRVYSSQENTSPSSGAETDTRSPRREKTGPIVLGGSATSWANASFHYRQNFTIDHNKVSADLTDFPVLISVIDNDLRNGKLQADADDIMFTNASGARLAHEIEYFQQTSSQGRLTAWVRVPTLSSTTDTVLSMYYGNDSLSSQQNATGVWDSGFAAVWHLGENPLVSQMNDSTANDNGGATHGTITPLNWVTGKAGYALDFNGADNYVDVGNPSELQITGALTVEAWLYTGSVTSDFLVAKSGSHGDIGWGLFLTDEVAPSPDGGADFHFSRNGLSGSSNMIWVGYGPGGPNRVNASQWINLVSVFSPSTFGALYINGQLVDNETASIPASIFDTSANVTFGRRLGSDQAANYRFDGILDEIRISNVTRSTAWIGTYYNNTNSPSSFYTIGSEDVYDVTDPVVDAFGVDDDGTGNPQFWADVSDPFGALDNVTIELNGTEHAMGLNGTGHWIYIYNTTAVKANFTNSVDYQIVNASDIYGNYLAQASTSENHALTIDTVAPVIAASDWFHDPYNGSLGTTVANPTDAWGEIDTVTMNVIFSGGVPRNNLTAIMSPTASGYVNDTLQMTRGIFYVEFIINDTANNTFISPAFFGFAGPNDVPTATNLVLSPNLVRSNESLQLSYDYGDVDGDGEAGTEIRWYKNGVLQGSYNDATLIPASALVKGDQWNATVRPKDGRDFGVPVWSSTITVQNVAPEILALEFIDHEYAAFVVEDEDLNISYTFSDGDADADDSIIRWYKNGSYNSTYDNLSFIPANQTRPGEAWSFEIVPFDGTDYGPPVKSQEMTIESRPTIIEYGVTPRQDADGHYEFWVKISDPRNNITEAKFRIFSETGWAVDNGTHWVLDHRFDLRHLASSTMITITAISEVESSGDEISSTTTFSLTVEDKAPPRVVDADYSWDDDNPINITFTAEIDEFGSGVAQIILFYDFIPASATPEPSESPSNSSSHRYHLNGLHLFAVAQTGDSQYAFPHNATMRPLNATHWSVEVPFAPKGDTKVYYRIYTVDNAGNVNSQAYYELGQKEFVLKGGGGLDLMLVLGLLAVVALVFAIGSIAAIRMWRTTELVGLDKERVLGGMEVFGEDEVKAALAHHTLGVVVSFFDQRHGPIPIVITPEILRDNFDKLVELSDQSFSTCQFMDNFEEEKFAVFDFLLAQGIRINSISFAFALDRPTARGGAENMTLNILVQPDVFPLVNQFVDYFSQKVHEIHQLMDKAPSERDKILEKILELRKEISYVVLSYEELYGTTDLVSEEIVM